MANFILSYDLNGPYPSHRQVDELLARIGASRFRILETVWWVKYGGTAVQLRDNLLTMLRREDRLFVAEVTNAAWHNLLIDDASFKSAFVRAW